MVEGRKTKSLTLLNDWCYFEGSFYIIPSTFYKKVN
jgi:hypothetical protein